MSQDSEKYLYFNVGLLQNSFALDALTKDALKHHMIDQPGQLIALRLTEYYELLASGVLQAPFSGMSGGMLAASSYKDERDGRSGGGFSSLNGTNVLNGHKGNEHLDSESIVATSPDAEQNAEAAADYWETL